MSELNQVDVATPTPLKLRGSCEPCSVSKVRCDKAKPACSRCARRKIACEYVATKRVGRKQNSTRRASITSPVRSRHDSRDMSQTITVLTHSPSQALPPADMGMTLMGGNMDVDVFMSNADSFDYSVFSSMTSTNTNTNTSSSVQTPSPQASSSTATTTSLPVWDLFSDFFPVDPTLALDLDGTSAQERNANAALYDDFEDLFATPSKDDTSAKANAESSQVSQGTTTPLFPEHSFATGPEDVTFVDQPATRPAQHVLQRPRVPPPPLLPGDESFHVHTQALPEVITAQQAPAPPRCGPCIIEALALMRQLFPHGSTSKVCSSQTGQASCPHATTSSSPTTCPQLPPPPPPPPTFETITSQNEAVIDACIAMLRCPCSEDGYLLAVVSLIVFKVLAWYAAAVHATGSETTTAAGATAAAAHSFVPGGGGGDGGDGYAAADEFFDAPRVAAQLVLGKMHRVQHLVNQLSGKLKAKRQLLGGGGGGGGGGDGRVATSPTTGVQGLAAATGLDEQQKNRVGCPPAVGAGGGLPVSGVMLEQLEVDLRKRLRALSLEIIGVLKRE